MKDSPLGPSRALLHGAGEEVGPWKGFFLVASPAEKLEGGEQEERSVSGRGERKQDCWPVVGTRLEICGHELGMHNRGCCMDFLR